MDKSHNQKSISPVNHSLDSQKISFGFLRSHLWSAADILRGSLDSSEYRQPVMTLLFLKRLNDTFKEKVHILSRAMGVKANNVIIKNLKNRWASITKNNEINLNINLIKAPPEIIDYIIIHELCHFKIKGHSYNFWNLMRRYCPEYPKFIQWLNINGKNLLS